MKTMVEFFSGSSVLSREFELAGYDVFTIDNDESLSPDLVADVLTLKLSDLPERFRNPDVAFFGVPCTKFSVAGRLDNFVNHVPQSLDSCIALALVYKCLDLIKEMNPKSWFIENPMGYLRTFPFMKKLIRRDVWYCQYGDTRAKPTDIWTNRGDWISKTCFNENPNCKHERAPRGCRTGTQGLPDAYTRGIYPALLCKELVSLCDGGLKSVQSLLDSPGPVNLDGDKMKNMIKLKDVGDHNRLYAFLTQEQANDFCDSFDRPQDLVGVDVR